MTEKGRQNTGGGHPLRYRGRAELVTACHRFDPARRGGGASSARRGLSGAIYPAGRGGAAALSYIAMYGAAGCDLLPARASSARRGAAAWRGLSSVQRRRARSSTGAASSSRHGKAAHGKRPTENGQQKRGRRGAGRVYLFFRVKFSGGWNHPPPVLLSSGGWNPSRAILSRVAVKMYPCTLSPA